MAKNRQSKALREDERLLIRRLHGELEPEAEEQLRRREEADPELARRAAELAAVWRRLTPPPPLETGDLNSQVMAQIRSETGRDSAVIGGVFLGHSPWSRLGAAAILVLGMTFGLSFDEVLQGSRDGVPITASSLASDPDTAVSLSEGEHGEEFLRDFLSESSPSLADAYWQALEETEGRLSGLEEKGPIS